MELRKAHKRDAKEGSYLIHRAVGELANSVFSSNDDKKIRNFLSQLFMKGKNRVSHEYADVIECDGKVVGLALSYPGYVMEKLDKPILEFLKGMYKENPKKYKENVMPIMNVEEAAKDEYYLDSLAISPKYSGKGFGSSLIKNVIKRAKDLGFKKTSLIVEVNNKNAEKLYKKLGYKKQEKVIMKDIEFYRMIKSLS
jgi:ribosomal protein S18 acetylase RimI-like enzyme